MYENALHAMHNYAERLTGNWVSAFGYEIANEDWHIQYPHPDDELHRRITQQLEIARSRLSGYMVAMRMAQPAAGYGSNASQFRVDPRGNVTPVGGQPSSDEMQRRLAAHRPEAGQQAGGWDAHQVSVSAEMVDKEEARIRQMEQQIRQRTGQPPPLSPQQMQQQMQQPHPQQAQQPLPPQVQQLQQPQMQPPPEQQEMHVTASVHGVPQAQRPQNWGLKGETRFTSGISRTVRIRCEADRFVLLPQTGLRTAKVVPITDSVFTAADQLVQAIWEFQESWDGAGANIHWRPILEVQVSPGGERRLSELKSHLKNSGLVIAE